MTDELRYSRTSLDPKALRAQARQMILGIVHPQEEREFCWLFNKWLGADEGTVEAKAREKLLRWFHAHPVASRHFAGRLGLSHVFFHETAATYPPGDSSEVAPPGSAAGAKLASAVGGSVGK